VVDDQDVVTTGVVDADVPRTDVAESAAHPLHGVWHRLREWLPQGNMLHSHVFAARHRMITRLALVQAVALGVYGIVADHDASSALVAVLVAGLPALGGLLTSLPRAVRMLSVVTSLMFASASLVDLTHGLTEAHFHFFVMLGVVSLYQDWAAFGLCVLITVVHHALMGLAAPGTVFATAAQRSHPVQWALIHGGFILAASITHIVAWRFTEQLERRDPLTQLPNRAAFADQVDQALGQHPGPVSVLFVDLDNFKAINDSGGHHLGDLALTHAATVMADNLRPNDVIARLGGDEFAVLVLGDATLGERLATRILKSLQEPFTADGREVLVTASIGVADTELTISRVSADLLRGADLAMYCAKSSGRNKLVRYSAEVDIAVRERAALAADLQHALERNELDVYYQPVVLGEPPRVCGVEALARWHHPRHGMVPPDTFIPLAEESGLIKTIGAFVFRVAATQVAAWHRDLPGCADLQLAVNLSPVQLRDPTLVAMIGDTLGHSGLAPGHLIVEVTESMLLAELDLARRQLEALRSIGAQVAIDDFGTGYSSLSYLAKLPADQVKIDKSFVQDLAREKSPSVALVRSIIDMATALGLDVQAEGVEIDEQQAILSGLGCERAQGFLYSRPLPSADFAQFMSATPRVLPTVELAPVDADLVDEAS
jgi:diguanylate cyclase (GGDEF)-like protein